MLFQSHIEDKGVYLRLGLKRFKILQISKVIYYKKVKTHQKFHFNIIPKNGVAHKYKLLILIIILSKKNKGK